jgi:hypothetical protein
MAHLAIAGGTPLRQKPFLNWPIWDQEEVEAVQAVVTSGQWGSIHGTEVQQFEKEFAAYQDAAYGIAVVNGTVALKQVGDLVPERRARVGGPEWIGRDPDAALVLPQPRREERYQGLEEILLRSIELTEMVTPRNIPDRRHPRGTERRRGRTCSRH